MNAEEIIRQKSLGNKHPTHAAKKKCQCWAMKEKIAGNKNGEESKINIWNEKSLWNSAYRPNKTLLGNFCLCRQNVRESSDPESRR